MVAQAAVHLVVHSDVLLRRVVIQRRQQRVDLGRVECRSF
jgi:hypothetical protein